MLGTKSGSSSCQTATDILVVGAISLNSHLFVSDLMADEMLVEHFPARAVRRDEGNEQKRTSF